MGFTKDPNHRRRVDAETQRNRDAEVARMRRVTASGTARRWGRSSRCPRDRPRLLQDGRGTFAGQIIETGSTSYRLAHARQRRSVVDQ
jgi:hypothetical protein